MNKPILICTAMAMAGFVRANAEVLEVKDFRLSGPYIAPSPLMLDSTDVNGKKFDAMSALELQVPVDGRSGSDFSGDVLPAVTGVQVLTFTIDNADFAKAKINVGVKSSHKLYVDGKPAEGNELSLRPATHTVAVKYYTSADEPDSVKVTLEGDNLQALSLGHKDSRRITLLDILEGRRIVATNVSPDGRYLLTTYSDTEPGGRVSYSQTVTSVADGSQLATFSDVSGWIPGTSMLYRTKGQGNHRQLVSVDPATGAEQVMATGIPSNHFYYSPNGSYLLYYLKESAPAEKDADIYEIVNPEDRQPGYRDRNSIMKYDLATGTTSRLTFGHHDTSIAGMSRDGKKLLLRTSRQRFEKRPTTLSSLILLDLATMEPLTILEDDGFLGGAALSPDGTMVAVTASPEGLGGIGLNLPEGMTPSMYDYQLYVVSTADGKAKALTRHFNPSVSNMEWGADGNIYFTAENRDRVDLYRVNPSTGRIEPLNALEENVMGFSVAEAAPVLAYFGQGAQNSDRSYTLDTKHLRHRLADDLSAERLDGIAIGETHQWDFVSSRGDTICARYILPADFDPARKYPLIVNYYGGCSPTERTFESRYPHHLYAANGYVVLCIVPSGAAGFGQEHAARHVNTAGEGVAQDIIDGTVQFRDSHPWVDGDRIGCIGASYGGFMTQYLQTVTDIFAAAISHAGISDHTSYWGEGYWGYSYSEVSMANSYPWSDTDLYVKQSPLYRADKIKTPILFLHGDHDTNVPYGESIQMFTALKLLGVPTALVAVKDTNHQVTDYVKRQKWQDTIFAWFARYLKDDPTWWEELYPAKDLE